MKTIGSHNKYEQLKREKVLKAIALARELIGISTPKKTILRSIIAQGFTTGAARKIYRWALKPEPRQVVNQFGELLHTEET